MSQYSDDEDDAALKKAMENSSPVNTPPKRPRALTVDEDIGVDHERISATGDDNSPQLETTPFSSQTPS